MREQRWLRVIPIAMAMYTIAYVDRTNVSLALEPKISGMMGELGMDQTQKGEAMGVFFIGYALLQVAGARWAVRWGARRVVSVFLIAWGACAVGCGLTQSFRQFGAMRILLGLAESGVFPAATVLMANWFPRAERARATAYWMLCQPIAVAGAAPITSTLLGAVGWRKMLIIEGLLPMIWLPVWWFGIRDHPREAAWISAEERDHLETVLDDERAKLEPPVKISLFRRFTDPSVFVMCILYFLHNFAAYGCMTFFTNGLKARGFTPLGYGIFFAIPYVVTAIIMVINSRHSDKTHERRGHVAAVYFMSGTSLIVSVLLREHFWLSYAFLCFAIPGPFAAMGPFWSIPAETLPRGVMGQVTGLVNGLGNLGGMVGPWIVGLMTTKYSSTAIPFTVMGFGMLICVGLAFLLPKAPHPMAGVSGAPGGVSVKPAI